MRKIIDVRTLLVAVLCAVSTTVSADQVIEARLAQRRFPENAFQEQEVVTLSFGDEGFSMPNGAMVGYVFLVPRNENSSNLVECLDCGSDWKFGAPVASGDTRVGPFNMYLLDGSQEGVLMSYDIVVRTTENWDEGDIVTDWTSSGFSFSVTNVVPGVKCVSMSGTRLNVNGGTMTPHAILGVSKTFTAQTTEPSDNDFYADKPSYADATKAFTTEWTFDYGYGMREVCYVYGPPSRELSYAFKMVGTCEVTVRMRDKDMDHDRDEWGPAFTFSVVVDERPTISLTPYTGQTSFSESATGQQLGRINVNLSMMPSEKITVHLDVSREGGNADNYPLPILNSYDLDFGGSSVNTTNASVYFTSLDGTPMGDSMGYVITATVTNRTLNADGVAWTNLYRSAQLPITVFNEAPQIVTSANTDVIMKTVNESFRIAFRVQDVPADMADGLYVTWMTSMGDSTNYQITATGVGQYATYSGLSPTFSFRLPGSMQVTLLVEDKDGGLDQMTWNYYVEPRHQGNTYIDASGVTWRYTISDGEVLFGPNVTAVPITTSGAIVIPPQLGGCCVTSIGEWAFAGCSGLTSVTIPNGVTNVGSYAFSYCRSLTNVDFLGNAPTMGEEPFAGVDAGCTVRVRRKSAGWNVEIPGAWHGMGIQYMTAEQELATANAMGEGVVEFAGVLPDVEVASGVTLVVRGEHLDAADLAGKVTAVPHEVGQDASLFKVVASTAPDGSVSLSVVLDETAINPDSTAGEIVGAANMTALGEGAAGENVNVILLSAKPGLYYGIAAANELSQLDAAAADVPLVRAGNGGVSIPVTKPAGSAAFFKVIVSDRAQ